MVRQKAFLLNEKMQKKLSADLIIIKKQKIVKGFSSVKNREFRDPNLIANEFRVLMVLFTYYNEKKRYSYPSNKRIEIEANICRTTRIKIIKSLIKKGKIRIKFRSGTTSAFTFPCKPFPSKKKIPEWEKKKKPYFWGRPMRLKNGKWFVVDEGGQWLEFVGEEKDILWK